jgi:putative ABC transport system substrate-binding protein
MQPELAGKRLEVLKHIVPALSRLAFLGSTRDPAAQQFNAEARAGAERLGIRFKSVLVRGPEAFEEAFAEMDREQTQAVIVQPTFVLDRVLRARVVELASKHRLPMISDPPEFARAGGLVSYGVDSLEFYGRTAAGLVDRILKGAAPGELPIEQPTVFILVINLGTAKALGVEIPPTLLARADEVIE